MRRQRPNGRAAESAEPAATASTSPGNAARADAAGAAPAQDPAAALAGVDGGSASAPPPSGGAPAAPPRAAPLSAEVEAAMTADVEAIVAKLREQILTAEEEGEIVGRLRHWREEDTRAVSANPSAPEHQHMDRMLLKLKMRSFTRSTAATGFIEWTMNAYDTLWNELEDDRLASFRQLIQGCRQATTGPETAPPENLFSTLAREEGMGLLGMVGGMSAGLAGIVDTASQGITSVGNLIGERTGAGRMEAPIQYAPWIEQQYNFMGEAAFGRAWNQPTTMGATSGQIGMGGGRVISALTMLGAGGAMSAPGAVGSAILPAGEAALFATRALAAIGIVGSVGGVVTAANAIATDIQRLQTARRDALTARDVLTDGEFLTHVASLATSVFGAVSGGVGLRTPGGGAAPVNPLTVATIGAFIESAGAAADVNRIVEVLHSRQTEAQKDAAIRASIESFINHIVNGAGGLAGVRDAHQAQARAAGSQAPAGAPTSGSGSGTAGASDSTAATPAATPVTAAATPAGAEVPAPVTLPPVSEAAPVSRPAAVETPAPVTLPPVSEAAPVSRPSAVETPAPVTLPPVSEAAPVSRPAAVETPAPVTLPPVSEAAPVSRPAAVEAPAPVTLPPVSEAAPVSRPATEAPTSAPHSGEAAPASGTGEPLTATQAAAEATPAPTVAVDPEVQRAASAPTRAPEGPITPEATGFAASAIQALQLAADVLGVIIKARPSNPDSLPHLAAQAAVPKMELIKAKTINQIDVLLGANPDNVGLVGLFEPNLPPEGLAPDVRAAAMRRYQERHDEYHHLIGEYQSLVQQGILRIEGGVLQIADPTRPGGAGEPHGGFRPIAGDIDLFDITHRDGTPLSPAERDAVMGYLRSAGIGVEHGAHAWWQDQNPASFDPAMDARIRGQHTTGQQLVTFTPGGSAPQGTWADTHVTAPEPAPGTRTSPIDLGRAQVTSTPGGPGAGSGSAGAGADGSYVDLGRLLDEP